MPDDLDFLTLEPRLQGTARLAESALNAPPPPVQAEAESRRQVEQLMQEAALSPKVLREAVREQPQRPWWRKFSTKGQ
jgi:hypothetical protein